MQNKIPKNYFFKLTNDGNDYKCYSKDDIIKYQKKNDICLYVSLYVDRKTK